MKRKITFLLSALFALTLITQSFSAMGQTTITMSSQGWTSGSALTSTTISDDYFTISFEQNTGSSAPAYYTNSPAGARLYAVNSMTITAEDDVTITTVEYTFNGKINKKKYGEWTATGDDDSEVSDNYDNTSNNSDYTYSNKTLTWEGEASSVVFQNTGNTGTNVAVTKVVVSYTTGGGDTFSVTYRANGGTGSNFVDNNSGAGYASGATVTVVTNEGNSGHPNFTKTGYSVIFWSDKADWEDPEANLYDPTDDDANSFEITGNTDLYAVWDINQYTVALPSIDGVTLSATYGTSSSITVGGSAQIDYNTEITVGATGLADGKAFVWDVYKTDESATKVTVTNNKFNVPAFNVTISGNIVDLYTIEYDCNGGTSGCPSDVTDIASGTAITLAAAPTKSGYIFNGWNDGTNTYAAGASYTVTGNKTLTAQWTAGVIGSIVFSSSAVAINSASVKADDNLANEWTITTAGTTSFTSNDDYYQVGSSSNPATSITFTTTLPYSVNIASFSAKFGGFSGTAGTVTLKVGNTSVGSGSLNGTSDVTVSNSSTATGTELTVTVTSIAKGVKCYYISYTFTSNNPIIFANNTVNLESTDTDNSFDYDVFFPVDGKSLSATTTTGWISNVSVDAVNKKITFETTENTSTTDDREGSITLSYYNATNKVVTINQSKVDYVNVPFTYTGNASGTITGFTKDGLGTYSDEGTPIKFSGTGNYLIIKFKNAPASISYDVKVNGTWNAANYFDVMTSNDGIEWTTVKSHTTMTETATTFTCLNLGRYVKWIYTIRKGGNVGLGNIRARVEYDVYGTASVASLSPTSSKKCTIYNGGVLTVTGTLENGTAANLIIEDGGQLIVSNDDVAATFKKSIDTPSSKTDVYGWYTISSPVHDDGEETTIDVENVTNLVLNTDPSFKYDMFAYDEVNQKWLNRKKSTVSGHESDGFDIMNKGQGYIYRNSGEDIEFVGIVNYGDYTINDLTYTGAGDLAGFHLFGNPYSHNIKLTNTTLLDENGDQLASQLSGCYILRDDSWGAEITTGDIAPNQGFLVKISSSAKKIKFSETKRGVNYHSDNIKFMVANNQHEDVAYALFKDAIGLNKINHRNPEVPMLYINQNGEDFAIASMSDDTKAFNLNFKAGTMGKYTLSYKADGVFKYLHIYDRLTNTDVDMLLEGEYSFIATPNDNENRFIVMLGYMPDYSEGNDDVFAYQSGNEVLVSGTGELQIFDVTGRRVMTTTINGAESINLSAQGVYILRLVGNEVKTQKIVVR